MSEFEKKLNRIICNGVTIHDEKFYLFSNLVSFFKDWQPPKPLVKVPQFLADWIKALKAKGINPLMNSGKFGEAGFTEEELQEIIYWINEHQEEYMRAWLDGYTVEKEKLYLLKHIDFCKTDKDYDWFMIKFSDGALNHLRVEKGQKPATIDCRFTQSEIDKLNIGSYEQIKVI